MLMVANNLLETEATAKAQERETFLAEACPPVDVPYSRDELLVRRSCADCAQHHSMWICVKKKNCVHVNKLHITVFIYIFNPRLNIFPLRNFARNFMSRLASVKKSDTLQNLSWTWYLMRWEPWDLRTYFLSGGFIWILSCSVSFCRGTKQNFHTLNS